MPTPVWNNRLIVAMTAFFVVTISCMSPATAQTFTVTRLDGDLTTSAVSDPVIDVSVFEKVDGLGFENASIIIEDNIDGPSVIRIPSWIPVSERVHEDAIYYTYFAHHGGDNIRLAWSSSITGPWNLFNAQGSSAPERAWGVAGNNTGTLTPGSGVSRSRPQYLVRRANTIRRQFSRCQSPCSIAGRSGGSCKSAHRDVFPWPSNGRSKQSKNVCRNFEVRIEFQSSNWSGTSESRISR